jgi:hypothetical protein
VNRATTAAEQVRLTRAFFAAQAERPRLAA